MTEATEIVYATATSDTGAFALIPEWVLDADITARSVRLYAILGRYADNATGQCWPSRRTLCERLSCSITSLDRAFDGLYKIGAVEKTARTDPKGGQITTLYTVIRANPLPPPLAVGGGVPPGRLGGVPPAEHRTRTKDLELEPRETPSQTGGRSREPLPPRRVCPGPGFVPTDSHREYARGHGLDLDAERAHWLDWCEANGKLYANPAAGLSTWLRQAVAYGRGRGPKRMAGRVDFDRLAR